jgi:uncharacterized ferritin-like protein (DUF455 family)
MSFAITKTEVLGSISAKEDIEAIAEISFGLRSLRHLLVHQLLLTPETKQKIKLTKLIFLAQCALNCSRSRIQEIELLGLGVTFSDPSIPNFMHTIENKISLEKVMTLATAIALKVEQHADKCSVANGPTAIALGEIKKHLEPLLEFVKNEPTTVMQVATKVHPRTISDWWADGTPMSLPLYPKREEGLSILPVSQCESNNQDDLAFIHGKIFNIEITAAEICGVMLERFGDLPNDLECNLARQCWDEGRHAELLLDQLELRGGFIGQFPSHLHIWNNSFQARNIAQALCIEQVIGEGHALGCDLVDRDRFLAKQDYELARLCEWIYLDEIDHVRQGLKWYRILSGQDAVQEMITLEDKFPSFLPPSLDVPLRQKVGFTDTEISRLQARIVVPPSP